MYLNDRNMATNTNLRFANLSSNYYVIMMVEKKLISNSNIFFAFGGTKFPFEARDRREAT